MSITVTVQQARAIERLAEQAESAVTLHQIGKNPDVYVAHAGAREPETRITPTGEVDPIEPRGAARAAKLGE